MRRSGLLRGHMVLVIEDEDPAAERTARLRGKMQKTVSEELGAPLTALLELPRLLVDGLQKPLGDTERGQLEIPQERGQEILELIEGLTALSGLQAGGLKITKASTDVATLIQRVVRTLQPRAAAKGNRIETDIKPGVGPVVTDARRVEQVLGNLVLSAVKYTEVGEIRVTCYQRDREVVLTVVDDGVSLDLPGVLPGGSAGRADVAGHRAPAHRGRAAGRCARWQNQDGERDGPWDMGHRHSAGPGIVVTHFLELRLATTDQLR
jgi:signal transduction histidine kinase